MGWAEGGWVSSSPLRQHRTIWKWTSIHPCIYLENINWRHTMCQTRARHPQYSSETHREGSYLQRACHLVGKTETELVNKPMNQLDRSSSENGKCCELNTTLSRSWKMSGTKERRAKEGIWAEWHLSCNINDQQIPTKQRSERNLPGWRHNYQLPEVRSGISKEQLRRSVRLKCGSKVEGGGDGTRGSQERIEHSLFSYREEFEFCSYL